jgi:hypothetical protein
LLRLIVSEAVGDLVGLEGSARADRRIQGTVPGVANPRR